MRVRLFRFNAFGGSNQETQGIVKSSQFLLTFLVENSPKRKEEVGLEAIFLLLTY